MINSMVTKDIINRVSLNSLSPNTMKYNPIRIMRGQNIYGYVSKNISNELSVKIGHPAGPLNTAYRSPECVKLVYGYIIPLYELFPLILH